MELEHTFEIVPVRCERCGIPIPIEAEELLDTGGPGPSGENMPVVTVPPANCTSDPNGDGIIHIRCLTDEEFELADDEADAMSLRDPEEVERARDAMLGED